MYALITKLSSFVSTERSDSTEYHIAKKMLDNIEHIPDYSISEMANMCDVSKSKLSKFVRKLGYEDYIDFKWSSESEEGRLYYTDKDTTINITDYICQNSVNSYLQILFNDINNMFENADITKIDLLVKYIHDYKNVASFGMGYSESAALDLSYKMAFYLKYIFTTLNMDEQLNYIEKAKDDTLVIVFSNLGSYIKNQGKVFKHTKAKVVLITSNERMSENPNIDFCLNLKYFEKVQNHPIMYQLMIEQIALRYQQIYGLPNKR